MEIVLGSIMFVGSITAIIAIDEFINWMNYYDEAGADDREFQRQKEKDQSYGIEYRE